MKWKQVYRTEHKVKMDDYVNGSLGVPAIGLVGKTIRVTIEEAVDEQARKGLLAYGGAEARRIHDAAFPHAPLAPGRNIRITMEEEVKECCEKWRASKIISGCSCVGTSWGRECRFCPECGKRLEA